jgi:multisubunit Na+/H+ antiporter MnhF subunit
MNEKFSNTLLIKLGLRFSVVFFIVAVLIKAFLSFITNDFSTYIKTTEFRNYILILAIFSFVYGFLMAHFQLKKNKKK